jgi:hypothetical protein
LSEPIQPVIDRINPDLADDSVGIYFDNRYWLALPLDSEVGAGDAMGNNAILVYNFINQGWESVDTVADSRWGVLDFHVGRSGERNDLYAINSQGGIHLLDAVDQTSDELAVAPGESVSYEPVPWVFETRQYAASDGGRARFTRIQAQVEGSGLSADGNLMIKTEDPDASASLGLFSDHIYGGDAVSAGEDYSIRCRTGGKRGQGASVRVSAGYGRPRIKSIALDASVTNRSTITQG